MGILPIGMPPAPRPLDEVQRLRILREYDIIDSPPEEAYDELVALASYICDTPIALVTLVDDERQWFKARRGLAMSETSRDIAFCAYAILGADTLVVNDALADPRFAGNPLVTNGPQVRFYAGAPLITATGYELGTLCVMDQRPRTLTSEQVQALEILARTVVTNLELRRLAVQLADALGRADTLTGLLPICAHCKRIRDDRDYWHEVESYTRALPAAEFSHSMCPDCLAKLHPEIHE